jgi:rare lipoprotein A
MLRQATGVKGESRYPAYLSSSALCGRENSLALTTTIAEICYIEAFNPEGLSAAHKYLPIPMFVKATNLENLKSIIVRVNDRGPFPNLVNAKPPDCIIDPSAGATPRLGYYAKGTARVRAEAIRTSEGDSEGD